MILSRPKLAPFFIPTTPVLEGMSTDSVIYCIYLTPVLAPRWKKGYAVEVVFVSMVYILFMLGQYLQRRDDNKTAAAVMVIDEEKLCDESTHVEEIKC